MKIHPDQIKALNKEQAKTEQQKPAEGKFGDVLAQEVHKDRAPGETAKAGGVKPLHVPFRAGVVEPAGAEHIPQGREIMENLDSLLAQWENYAGKLSDASGAGLKDAYGVLENIDSGVKELKAKAPDLGERHPGLKSMIDELEILATTERIKFVRGDYT
jgi:hypothetical protein